MEEFKLLVYERNNLWRQLKFENAIDKFYNKDVIVFDDNKKVADNSESYKKLQNRFLKQCFNVSVKIKNVILSQSISITEWYWMVDYREQGTMKFGQLSIQHWKDRKIYLEGYYYNKNTEEWN